MSILLDEQFTSGVSADWVETDTENKLTAASGGRIFVVSGKTVWAWGNPGLRTAVTYARATLGAYATLVRLTNLGNSGPGMGLRPTLTATNPDTDGAGVSFIYPEVSTKGGAHTPLLPRARSVDHLFIVIPRPGGGYLNLACGGGFGTFPTARLLYPEDQGTDANLYGVLSNEGGRWYADYAKILHTDELTGAAAIYATQFGPTTCADTFTRANGNLSGSTTEVGSKTWVVSGTPTIATNKASLPANAWAFVNAGSHGTLVNIIEATVTTGATPGLQVAFRGDGGIVNTLGFYAEATECGIWNYATSSIVPGAQSGAFNAQANTTYRVLIYDYGTHVRVLFGTIGGTLNDPFNLVTVSTFNTNTYAGINAYNSTHTFDNFAVWPDSLALPTNLGPFPAIPIGTGTPIVSDPFTNTNGTTLPTHNADWTVHNGTWEINTNKARMTTASVNGVATRSTGSAGVNHQAKSTITLPSTTVLYINGDWFTGVICRYTDGNNYIQARFLYQDNSPEVEVWEYVAGVADLIGYINLGADVLQPSSVHTLALAVNGNEIAAYHNGTVVVQAYTTLSTGSRAGIGVADNLPHGQPSWDDFEITATAATPGQYGRPNADSSVGTWTTHSALTTGLWDTLNEAVPDDADFIRSVVAPSSTAYEASFASLVDPVSSTGHVLEVRARHDNGGGGGVTLTSELRQGANALSTPLSVAEALTSSWVTYSYQLSAAQADAITDYSTLRVRVTATQAAADVPTPQAVGGMQASLGALTSLTWPAHLANDIALLFVESAGGQAVTLSTPAGFVAVTGSPSATGATTSGTRISVFWCRATSSAMANPVVADSGDHQIAAILTFRGCIATGNPWDVTAATVKAAASTNMSITGVTTTVANCLVVYAAAADNDANGARFSGEANASLTDLTEQFDNGSNVGNGGGIGVWTGAKATAGATGTLTATVTSSINAFLVLALKPAANAARAQVSWVELEVPAVAGTTLTRTTPAAAALLTTPTRTAPAAVALLTTPTRTAPAAAALLTTTVKTVPTSTALVTTPTRPVPAAVSLQTTPTRVAPAAVALQTTNARLTPAAAALVTILSRTMPAAAALVTTGTRATPAAVALSTILARTAPAAVALVTTQTRTAPAAAALVTTQARPVLATTALQTTPTRTISAAASLQATQARTVPTTTALVTTGTRTIPAATALLTTFTRLVPATVALVTTHTRSVAATVALLTTPARTVPTTAAFQTTTTRAVPAAAAFQTTTGATIPATTVLQTTGARTIPAAAALSVQGTTTAARTVPAAAALLTTTARPVPAAVALQTSATRATPATVALLTTTTRTVPALVALLTAAMRTIPASATFQTTTARTVPTLVTLQVTAARTIPALGALLTTSVRTVPSLVALQTTTARTVPASAALSVQSVTTDARTVPAATALLTTTTRTVPAAASFQTTTARTVPASAALMIPGLEPRPDLLPPLSGTLMDTGIRSGTLTVDGTGQATVADAGVRSATITDTGIRNASSTETGIRSATITDSGIRNGTLTDTGVRGGALDPA